MPDTGSLRTREEKCPVRKVILRRREKQRSTPRRYGCVLANSDPEDASGPAHCFRGGWY